MLMEVGTCTHSVDINYRNKTEDDSVPQAGKAGWGGGTCPPKIFSEVDVPPKLPRRKKNRRKKSRK